jgi:histone H3/H4
MARAVSKEYVYNMLRRSWDIIHHMPVRAAMKSIGHRPVAAQNTFVFSPNPKRLRELRLLQRSEKCLTSKAAVKRVTREIMQGLNKHDMNLRSNVAEAIQTASEDYLHTLFEKAALLAAHAGRTTVMKKDLDLLTKLSQM